MSNHNRKAAICIAGDFNVNLLSCDSNESVSEFLDFLCAHCFFPLIVKPTRFTHTTTTLIDNIFINNALSSTSGLIYADISDHLPIFATLEKSELALNKTHDNNNIKLN